MRVTFGRLPDRQPLAVLIERDDGVCYRLNSGPSSAALPHDLVHFTTERVMEIADGFWGAIAGGVVFHSMQHHSGRRPPHAAQRSAELIRQYRDRFQRAELIGGFVESVAELPAPTAADIARLARRALSTRPPGEFDVERVADAAEAIRDLTRRWAAVPVGGELVVEWPAHLRLRRVVKAD